MLGLNLGQILGQVSEFQSGLSQKVDEMAGQVLERIHPGRKNRRIWVRDGRAHIEVRGVHEPERAAMARMLEKTLRNVEGVDWAEVNGVLGRVVVMFDPEEGPSVDDLVDLIEDVEDIHGVGEQRFPHEKPDHPADIEPIIHTALTLGADVVGLGVSVAEQALHLVPLPAEIPTIAAFAENQPRIRRFFESHLGPSTTDLTLGLASAVTQAASQGPLALVVDMTHRANLMGELVTRRNTWERRESAFEKRKEGDPTDAVHHAKRPRRIPDGPVEVYSDWSSIATTAVFGTALAVTGSPRRAASAYAAGLPKAARQGREAFSAHLGRILSKHDALVLDRRALRKLDRLDVMLIDARAMVTGRYLIAQVKPIGTSDESTVFRRGSRLFRPDQPFTLRKKGSIMLGTLADLEKEGCAIHVDGIEEIVRSLRRTCDGILGVVRNGILIGIAGIQEELDPLAEQFVAQAHHIGLATVLVGGTVHLAKRLLVPTRWARAGRSLSQLRTYQREGHGVIAIGTGEIADVLYASDFAIGIDVPGITIPWTSDVLTTPGLATAFIILEAVGAAEDVSKRSAALAAAGSSVGGLWAMLGPASSSSTRASIPVNAAAFVSQIHGMASAELIGRKPPVVPRSRTPWHTMEPDNVLSALHTSRNGLSREEVGRRMQGPAVPPHPVWRFLEAVEGELVNPLTPVLAVGAGLAAAVGSVADAGLVAGVTVANALIGGVQRVRAEVSIEELLELSSEHVTVRRREGTYRIDRQAFVRGDIVELFPGDIIPADCRVLQADGLEVDESILTGESFPVMKSPAPVAGGAVADRTCMLYEGTTISSGTAIAVVVAVGKDTEIGMSLANAPEPPPSGVEARLNTLTKYTVPATIVSGAVVTGLSMFRHVPLQRAVSSGVSLMVAAVPEGLPLLATAAQLAAAHRLSKRGAMVRNPRTIEALGRVDTLCFDKTGTLTLGEISVQRVSDGTVDEHVDAMTHRGRCVLAGGRRASPMVDADGVKHLAHATDRAVIAGAVRRGIEADYDLPGWEMLGELAFDPARGYHAVIGGSDDTLWISVKGAPEIILPRCTTWRAPDGVVPMDRKALRIVEAEVERLANQGLRVLAVAERTATKRADVVDDRVYGMELLGFLGLADSVRPTTSQALRDLRSSGVEVVMITGDHPSTARAIANELGILNGHRVMTGMDLDALQDGELDGIIPDVSVFARVTPTHKVRIVEAYQRIGRVVAMTGDGANDAPAIRLANTGIALGGRGSTAAKEAADLVVIDDRIETILDAIVEGRGMWAAVRDALGILVGGNLGEVGFTLATTAIAGESPLDTRQLLLVNLLTDMLPAMTIALRPPMDVNPAELLHEGPDVSLGSELIQQIALRSVLTAGAATSAWFLARLTGTKNHANTVALATLVGTQLGQTALVGGKSPIVLASAAVSAAALAAIIETPVVNSFFGCTPLGPIGWGIAAGTSAVATGGAIVLPWSASKVNALVRNRLRTEHGIVDVMSADNAKEGEEILTLPVM
ncbi:MAG: HAD-IC family P-type ATPase [Candidatus Dormibacteria bacterium]